MSQPNSPADRPQGRWPELTRLIHSKLADKLAYWQPAGGGADPYREVWQMIEGLIREEQPQMIQGEQRQLAADIFEMTFPGLSSPRGGEPPG